MGYTDMGGEIVPKQFGLLHELLPRATRFGVLMGPSYVWFDRVITDAKSAVATFGGQVDTLLHAHGPERDIDAAFAELVQKCLDAFFVPDDARLFGRRAQILTLASRHAIPAIYFSRDWAGAGGLMSYGHPQLSRAAKPASIPDASSRARNLQTYRWCRQRGLNSSSTLQRLAL